MERARPWAAASVPTTEATPTRPPAKSGCITFPVQGSLAPNFSYIAAFPFQTGLAPQLVIEDSANNFLYVLANNGTTGSNGTLPGFSLLHVYSIPAADGAGPIYIGDFNHDGNTDLILNGQKGLSATVYFGDGAGGRLPPVPQNRYVFDHNVHSMLMQDVNGDGIADMVVEGDNGIIEIFTGNANGTFNATSIGGTVAPLDGFSGNGGHLAAINPTTLDILTTTPIGLSVLQNQGGLSYALKGIYNIGPGRFSYAMANFFGTGDLDFAADSPEGVAIVRADANGDGGFQTSNAYPTLSPALSATVGKFRNAANNPKGNLDVVAATGATQAQLLTGNGNGTFNTFPSVVDTSGGPTNVPASVWSSILSGDFDGDGNLDVLYSLTGLPQPPPSGIIPHPLYPVRQWRRYVRPARIFIRSPRPGNVDGYYPESAVADVNGDGLTDIVLSDSLFDGVLLGSTVRNTYQVGFNQSDGSNRGFSHVAAGFFKVNRTNKQDVIFQQGLSFIPYVNTLNGTVFLPDAGDSDPIGPATVLLTDVDGDGNGDLVVVYYNTQPTRLARARSRPTSSTSGTATATARSPHHRKSSTSAATTTSAPLQI